MGADILKFHFRLCLPYKFALAAILIVPNVLVIFPNDSSNLNQQGYGLKMAEVLL